MMNEEEEASVSPLRLTSQTFELISFIELNDLIREVFGTFSCGKKSLQGSLRVRCIDFKNKHQNLLDSIDEWKSFLYKHSENMPLLQNTKRFLKATLEHFIGDYESFLLVQKSQIETIADRIASLFNPEHTIKNYEELFDFGTPMHGIRAVCIKAQNSFLFRYLMGWMGLFFHISNEKSELRYLDPKSVKVKNPLMEKDDTSNYLSSLVCNPTLDEIKSYGDSFKLLKIVYGGDTRRIAKSCVGSKVFKKLDGATKQTLLRYFENFSAVAKQKITNDLAQTSRHTVGLTKLCSSIVLQGIDSDIFPEDNIRSCSKKIQCCFQNLFKPQQDTRIFETLDPCYDPVPVPFIEGLSELGFSMDFQRALFYNSMYFFKIFSLEVIRIYKNFVIENNRCLHYENKHALTAKNIEFIHSNVAAIDSTDDEKISIVKNGTVTETFETPKNRTPPEKKNHPDGTLKKEVLVPSFHCNPKKEPIVSNDGLRVVKSEINLKTEVDGGEDEILICSPAKKAYLCVTLDSDSDADT